MQRLVLLFMGLLTVMSSCVSSNKKIDTSILNSKLINKELFLGLPIQILKEDKYLLINDFRMDPMISIVDSTGHIIKKVLRKGRGAMEALPPLHLVSSKDSLFIFDRNSCKLYSLLKDSLWSLQFRMNYISQFPSSINMITKISSTKYLASGIFDEARFAFVNSSGKIIKFFGDYPSFMRGETNIPLRGKGMFHQTFFLHNVEKKLIAAVTSHVLDIYSFDDSNLELKLINRVLISPYKYTCRIDNVLCATFSDDTKRGMIDCCTKDKFIYILFSQRSNNNEKDLCEILKYDWMGNLIHKYKLVDGIALIVNDNNSDLIYAINNESELVVLSQ
ncbi:MAG: BF3164 family lipoprotein [Rikenellaceae bacterium]|nr:BF3164 family lipoprotein [Rikenellaceae bacterium]